MTLEVDRNLATEAFGLGCAALVDAMGRLHRIVLISCP